MKKILFVSGILFSFSTLSQNITLTWGIKNATSGSLRGTEEYPDPNSFAKFNYFVEGVHHVYELYNYEDLTKISKSRMEVKIDGYYYLVEKLLRIDNLTYAFMSSSLTKEGIKLLVQKYNEKSEPVGKVIELIVHGEKKRAYDSNFDIHLSKDRQKIIIGRFWEGNGKEEYKYVYRHYDLNLEPVGEENDYIGGFEFEEGRFASINKTSPLENKVSERVLTIYKFGGSVDKFPIDTKGFKILDVKFALNSEGNLTLAGFYSQKDKIEILGTFLLTFDLKTNQFIATSFDPFNQEITESGNSNNQKAKEKNKKQPLELLYRTYYMRDLISVENGATILFVENHHSHAVNNTWIEKDGDKYLFYYSKEGRLIYSKQIDHYIPSLYASHKNSSSFCFVQKDKLYLIFNDSPMHYDANGNYEKDENSQSERFRYHDKSKTENKVAGVPTVYNLLPTILTLDIKTGEIESRAIFSEENRFPILPGKFMKTNDPTKILMYANDGSNEWFGTLKL